MAWQWRVWLVLSISVGFACPAKAAEADAAEVSIAATIDRAGDFMEFGFGSLWMMSGHNLLRIDPGDNSVIEIAVAGSGLGYAAMAIGNDAVFIPDVGGKQILKVDPFRNEPTLRIPAALVDSEGSIGVGEGGLWAVVGGGDRVFAARFDTASGEETARIPLPGPSAGVAVAFGSVWITGTARGELYRIDSDRNQITATIALHPTPRFLAAGEGSVWVLNQGDGTVQRVDGQTGAVLATIAIDAVGRGGDIAVGGGSVWVTTHLVPVIKIDPETNRLVGKYKRPFGVYFGDAIRYGDGSLWISGNTLSRIRPP